MSIAPRTVTPGSQATLSWTSLKTKQASIDQNIGTIATSGTKSVTVQNNTTYTGTFTTVDGSTITCSASVSIKRGGGSCLNCGGGGGGGGDTPKETPHTPKILLSKTITKAGSYITLTQVPYTGFEAGPVATTFFWLAVLAVSVITAYMLTVYRPFERLRLAIVERSKRAMEQEHETHMEDIARSMTEVSPALHTHTMRNGVNDGVTLVEDRAHNERILLSPETTRMIVGAIGRSDMTTEVFLTKLYEQAKATYPREDGWILLSKERAHSILAAMERTSADEVPVVSTTHTEQSAGTNSERAEANNTPTFTQDRVEKASVRAAAQADTQQDRTATANVVVQFISYIAASEHRKTYELIRTLDTQHVNVSAFIAKVVRKLDDVYKSRLEGHHNPDRELADRTKSWTNKDFENVLGILVECIDYSYTNDRIGTKVALAKALDYFANKTNKK